MRLVGLGLLLLVLTQTAGCAIPFYWQAISGQIELLRKRVPIERVIENDHGDEELAVKLREVLEMRRFAVDELGLPDNKSYETYVDIDRRYVVWNAIAAAEFSVVPRRWCYPFVGCVSYRGFFSQARAERFAGRLAREGFDTYVAGATAYSTLGFFADPVLSTMLEGDEAYVAEVLFHELTHQRLYIKNDSDFSEALATAVAEYGTERWLRAHAEAAEADRYRERLRYRTEFAALISRTQAALAWLYARSDAPDVMRAAKRRIFDDMRAQYAALKRAWGGYGGYDAWFSQPLNNAQLAAVATYRRWVPGLRWQLERRGLEAFFADMQRLEALDSAQRQAQLEVWLDAALSGRPSPSTAAAPADAAARADSAVAPPAASAP